MRDPLGRRPSARWLARHVRQLRRRVEQQRGRVIMAALTLSELQGMRAGLIRARMSGSRRVKDQNGEEVEYRSDAELDQALRNCDALIAQMQSGAQPNVIRFRTTKGT